MIKSRRSSPRLSAKQLQKQEKSNSIQSLLKVTPILNGDRMLLYLPTMRRFDFDSHSLLSQRFVPFSNSQRKKKRERLHWPKSSPREWQRGRGGDGRSAKKETMHRETEKERVILYLPYTRQSAYRSPQEMRYSWESYVAETEYSRDRDTLVSPFESETPVHTLAEERDENARRRLLETGR